MIISPFTPLFFEDFKSDGIESRYIQVFATFDPILLNVFSRQAKPKAHFILWE